MTETEDRLIMARAELQQSQQTLEQKQELMEEVEARSRDLYDTKVRLEAHIADLESRKRAPLYQKKQEEELKAAMEKAQECEIRAVDAEIKYKEAKVCSKDCSTCSRSPAVTSSLDLVCTRAHVYCMYKHASVTVNCRTSTVVLLTVRSGGLRCLCICQAVFCITAGSIVLCHATVQALKIMHG